MKWTRPMQLLLLIATANPGAFIMDHWNVAAVPDPFPAGTVGGENSTPLKVDRLDPSSDRIIAADAKLERVATGYTWTEGPVWVKDSLFFADIPGNRILKWTPDAGAITFLKPSGYKGSVPYGGPEQGSNGMKIGRAHV